MSEMQEYTATRDFQVGDVGMSVRSGDTLLFDGVSKVVWNDTNYNVPRFRGLLRTQWIVPSDEYTGAIHTRVQAPVGMRPAIGGNPMGPQPIQPRAVTATTVSSDERIVGSSTTHARATNARNTNREYLGRSQQPQRPRVENEQVFVAREGAFSTPSKQTTDMTYAGDALRDAQNVQIVAGESIKTRESMIENMGEEEREEYLARIDAHRNAYVDDVPAPARKTAAKKPSNAAKETDPRRRVAKAICPDFPDNYDFDASVRKKIARIQADFEDRNDIIQAVAAAENDEMKVRLIEEFPSAFE